MSVIKDFIKKRGKQIGRAIGYIRDVTRYLGPEDDWIEGLRRRASLKLDPIFAPLGRPLVREKGARDFIGTVEASDNEFESAIMPPYQRNLTSTRKYRLVNVRDSEESLSRSSVVGDSSHKSPADDVRLERTSKVEREGRRQWADGSFVYDPDDTDWQHHVFIFPEEVGEDGTVKKLAVYGHKEKSAEKDPVGHVSDPQEPGDPDSILQDSLKSSNIPLVE